MFLDVTTRENEALLKVAFSLHQQGLIAPDSYILDVDMILANANAILEKAKRNNIQLYFMLKQFGRNPYIARKLIDLGYHGAVVVDFKEAKVMMDHNIPIGNIGHLVQVPQHQLEEVVRYRPEVITLYSIDKMKQINEICKRLNVAQSILLRVYDEGDLMYSSQSAGFSIVELPSVLACIQKLSHIHIAGVTSFPCVLYDEKEKRNLPTHNLKTVQKANEILRDFGIISSQINMPSSTCCESIDMIAKNFGTYGEPGHGLSGSTPSHARGGKEEKPAVVYVSEISHNFLGNAYCFGGGHYRRSHVSKALVGTSIQNAGKLDVLIPEVTSIDYHFGLSKECRIGDTVLMAFRFQIFVTRSDVVLVEGIQHNNPLIVGIYDSQGRIK